MEKYYPCQLQHLDILKDQKKSQISHQGIITGIEENSIYVTMLVNSACSACRAKGFCNPGELKEKVVEVTNQDSTVFKIGQEVIVVLDQSKGNLAVVLGYILPFMLLITALLLFSYVFDNEAVAGLLSLMILIPYFLILNIFKEKIKKSIEFRILR